ncbi:MAG: hypothetical protein HY394_02240 [Candidatus Diapherotrites archaeon]|nr:hypothetical protein [Candidatus Diapherotrites archaeon]
MGLTKHERKQLKKTERLESERTLGEKKRKENFLKNAGMAILAIAVVAAIAFFALQANANRPKLDTRGISFPLVNVHWHATPRIFLCGGEKLIPTPPETNPLLHTHEDRLIHIEGSVSGPEQITLERFFDGIGIKFSSTGIWGKRNGDTCENTGKAGKVSMKVNGSANTEFQNFVPKDGDVIEIRFE